MKRGNGWKRQFADRLFPESETLPLQPILELCGERRLLIENHSGVALYSTEKICIRVKFGQVEIGGRELRLCRMHGPQLVILGKIDSIVLFRGKA